MIETIEIETLRKIDIFHDSANFKCPVRSGNSFI